MSMSPRLARSDMARSARARARAEIAKLERVFRAAEKGIKGELGDRLERFKVLLNSEEHSVRVQAERLLLEQQFGKPRQAVEHSGQVDQVRYVVEVPKEETADEWLERHAKARAEAEEVERGAN